jgi:hypothetical protein
MLRRREDLVDGPVGRPVQGHPAVRPGARRRGHPLHEFLSVQLFARAEGVPRSFGSPGSPDVHDHLHVAPFDQVISGEPQRTGGLVVGRLGQNHREPAGDGYSASIRGPVDVGHQPDPVAHRDLDVAGHGHVVRRWARVPRLRSGSGRTGGEPDQDRQDGDRHGPAEHASSQRSSREHGTLGEPFPQSRRVYTPGERSAGVTPASPNAASMRS